MTGFCWVDVNALGPVHDQVPDGEPFGLAVKLHDCPVQTGALLEAVGV